MMWQRPIRILCLIILSVAISGTSLSTATPYPVTVYYFWGDGCPYCTRESNFLAEMQQKYPTLRLESYEVWNNPENRDLLTKMAGDRGIDVRGVPVTFIGELVWIGFNEERAQAIEQAIIAYITTPGPDARFGWKMVGDDGSPVDLPANDSD